MGLFFLHFVRAELHTGRTCSRDYSQISDLLSIRIALFVARLLYVDICASSTCWSFVPLLTVCFISHREALDPTDDAGVTVPDALGGVAFVVFAPDYSIQLKGTTLYKHTPSQ